MASDCPDILHFFSATAEQNSTQLARKQDINVLYKVCVFRADRKHQNNHPGLWLDETFSTSSLQPLNRIQRNWKGSKISTSLTKFVFFMPSGKFKTAALVSDSLRHFQLFCKSWTEFKETWKEVSTQRPLPSLGFIFRADRKTKMTTMASDLLIHFTLLWSAE